MVYNDLTKAQTDLVAAGEPTQSQPKRTRTNIPLCHITRSRKRPICRITLDEVKEGRTHQDLCGCHAERHGCQFHHPALQECIHIYAYSLTACMYFVNCLPFAHHISKCVVRNCKMPKAKAKASGKTRKRSKDEHAPDAEADECEGEGEGGAKPSKKRKAKKQKEEQQDAPKTKRKKK